MAGPGEWFFGDANQDGGSREPKQPARRGELCIERMKEKHGGR